MTMKDQLQALIAKWREKAIHIRVSDPGYLCGLIDCAAELEALLRAEGDASPQQKTEDDTRVEPGATIPSTGSTASNGQGVESLSEPEEKRCIRPDCGGGWTFDFGQRRVYCRTCEGL